MSPIRKRISSLETLIPMTPLHTQSTSQNSSHQKTKSYFSIKNYKLLSSHKKAQSITLTEPNKISIPSYHKYTYSTDLQRYLSTHGINQTLISASLSMISQSISDRIKKKKIIDKPIIIKPKQKYPMIFAASSFKLESMYPKTGTLHKFNNECKTITVGETHKVFLRNFTLVNKNKFSPKYQRMLDAHVQITDDEIERKISKSLSKNISVSHKAKAQVAIIQKDERIKHNKLLLERFKSVIIRAAIHFKRLKIPIADFYEQYKPSKVPFNNKNTQTLIFAIKSKDLSLITSLLAENKVLVLDFDYFKQTPLHWASKRNFYKAVMLISDFGACINAVDYVGRTPLHLAVQMNSVESAALLLMEGASTTVLDYNGKRPCDYCKTKLMKDICSRGMMLNVIHFLGKQKEFYQNVKRGMMYFIVNEIKFDIDKSLYFDILKKLEIGLI